MNQKPLKTYLRTFRRKACLTQDEVAFLIGNMCGTIVLRHESGKRIPLLPTLLAYSFIFEADIHEMYEGVFHEVRGLVQSRASSLLKSLERQPQGQRRDRKIAHVRKLLVAHDPTP